MKKGVVLVVVIGIMLVVFILGLVALYLMTQESRLAEHKIRRTRAFFAAQAAITRVVAQLRTGDITPPITINDIQIGAGLDHPYPIRVDVEVGEPITADYANQNNLGDTIVGTRPINATVNY
jgi:hypothetical protein